MRTCMVVELLRLRRVFLPIERVHSIDAQQVIISGVVNTVRFQRREQPGTEQPGIGGTS